MPILIKKRISIRKPKRRLSKQERCITKIKTKIKKGTIPKKYKTKKGKRVRTSPWAICKKRIK